jgi:hypothetical protein
LAGFVDNIWIFGSMANMRDGSPRVSLVPAMCPAEFPALRAARSNRVAMDAKPTPSHAWWPVHFVPVYDHARPSEPMSPWPMAENP